MKNIPTLRQLRFLTALAEHRHFGHAAESCLIGQSTLSAGIQELEDLLGVKLFERSKRHVAPTAIGLEIADRARELLDGAESLVDLAASARDPMSGPFQLGLIPTIAPFLVPQIMPQLKTAFPNLKIYLREEQTAQLVTRLNEGQLDAAILALPVSMSGIETRDIGRDAFWVIYPEGHRFQALKSIESHDLAMEDLLLLEDGHCMRDHALAACSLEAARRNSAFQGTSLHTLVQMVANGLGVTILPQMAINSGMIKGLPLGSTRLEGEAPYRRIALAWRRSSSRKETFNRLAETLAEMLAA